MLFQFFWLTCRVIKECLIIKRILCQSCHQYKRKILPITCHFSQWKLESYQGSVWAGVDVYLNCLLCHYVLLCCLVPSTVTNVLSIIAENWQKEYITATTELILKNPRELVVCVFKFDQDTVDFSFLLIRPDFLWIY